MAKDSEKMLQVEARNSEIGEIIIEGWSSHLWSDYDRNCIFMDGYLKDIHSDQPKEARGRS